jgi:hypothetical protein
VPYCHPIGHAKAPPESLPLDGRSRRPRLARSEPAATPTIQKPLRALYPAGYPRHLNSGAVDTGPDRDEKQNRAIGVTIGRTCASGQMIYGTRPSCPV